MYLSTLLLAKQSPNHHCKGCERVTLLEWEAWREQLILDSAWKLRVNASWYFDGKQNDPSGNHYYISAPIPLLITQKLKTLSLYLWYSVDMTQLQAKDILSKVMSLLSKRNWWDMVRQILPRFWSFQHLPVLVGSVHWMFPVEMWCPSRTQQSLLKKDSIYSIRLFQQTFGCLGGRCILIKLIFLGSQGILYGVTIPYVT